jgi:Skp family chaperone for outer membrane proteins
MDKKLQKKLERLGLLLAFSPLSQVVKDTILENAEHLTEKDVDDLITSLEREEAECAELSELFIQHDEEVAKDEAKIEKEAKQITDKVTKEFLSKYLLNRLQTK